MPLSDPLPVSGNSGAASLASTAWRRISNPSGLDTAINFFGCTRNPNTGIIAIGGNNSFTGTLASISPGLVTEHAALFTTVIAAGDARRMAWDLDNNGLMVQSGNGVGSNFARTDDGGVSWTAFAGLRALNYKGVIWWNSQVVCLADNIINLDISTDGGASFPTTADSQQPGADLHNFLYTNDARTHLVVAGDDGISWTTQAALTIPGNWNAQDLQAEGVTSGVASMAISPDGMNCCVAAQSSDLVFSNDGLATFNQWPRALNPFRNASTNQTSGAYTIWIESIRSFVIFGSNATVPITFIVSEDEIASLSGGSFATNLGTSSASLIDQGLFGSNFAQDGDSFLFPLNANLIYMNS